MVANRLPAQADDVIMTPVRKSELVIKILVEILIFEDFVIVGLEELETIESTVHSHGESQYEVHTQQVYVSKFSWLLRSALG
jgi:hypothetical protein